MSKELQIAGKSVRLTSISTSIKGLNAWEKCSFHFYEGSFANVPLLFVEPKHGNPTPRNCAITAKRLENISGLPIVFILKTGPNYERSRLIEKGVFFIMGDKYAYLPMLISIGAFNDKKTPKTLTPVAQYLLLYHVQVGCFEGKSIKAIKELVPYSYESVSLGITCLESLGLCQKKLQADNSKTVHFFYEGKELWEKAQPYMINPVEQTIYCDGLKVNAKFAACGINALSHYSRLNPDEEKWMLVPIKEYRELKKADALINPNPYDGQIIIEVWKYPAVSAIGSTPEWADRLSMVLSLKDDEDPRVEKEIEYVMNQIKW